MPTRTFRSRLMLTAALATLPGLATPALAQQAPSAAVQAAPASTLSAWDTKATDIAPDTSIRYGKLANGMRYAVWPNGTPKGAASVRLHFDFGSLGEMEGEEGLAHLIEHMAFNGTTNVPEGEMVPMLERLGMSFGADTNAVTGFDLTMYILEVPVADEERIDTALFLMREAASEIKFDQSALDAETGIIEGERRSRDSYGLRQYVAREAFVAPETPYADSLPIGLTDSITNVTSAKIRSLYDRYYRPENAVLLVVGDVDPAEIEAKIAKTFGDWRATGAAGAELPRGTVDLDRPTAFATFVDPAVPTSALITILQPYRDEPFTAAQWRENMLRTLAKNIVNSRFRKLSSRPDSVVLGGAMYDSEYKDAADYTALTVVTKDGEWKSALSIAEQEMRRALEHGFTESELKVELAQLETALRNQAAQANTRTNADLAQALVQTIDDDAYVITPQWRFDQFEKIKPTLTLAAVNEAVRSLLQGSQPLIHVSDKTPIEGGATALAQAYAASTRLAVAPVEEAAATAFAYDSFGDPGAIVSDERIEDLGIRTVRFANNVRLNIKTTDFEDGKVRFRVRVDGGSQRLPDDQPGLSFMMNQVSGLAGLEAHSFEELKEITAGRTVTPGLLALGDAFVAQGTVPPADLDLQMKVSAAYLTAPGFRPEAQSQWANLAPVIASQLRAQPQNVAAVLAPAIVANDDYRFGLPPAEMLTARTLDEYRAAFLPAVDDEPIEIAVVGDISEEDAIAAVANSFGALPARLAEPAEIAVTPARFRQDLAPVTLTHSGPADQALAMSAWATTDDEDYPTYVGLRMLQEVLDLLLTAELRERLGATYGASVANIATTYDGYGYFTAAATVAPDKVDEVQAAIANVVAGLRDEPISADLLARARNPQLEKIERSRRENGYWLDVTDQAQTEPEDLRRARIERQAFEEVTAEQIQRLAQRYLAPDARLTIRIVSESLARSN